jgi:Glycosyl transferases group 1
VEDRLKQVCYFNNSALAGPFRGYDISTLDPAPYFLRAGSPWRRRRARVRLAALLRADGVDGLYRERDPDYMRFAGDFVDAYRNAHLIIMSTYNPLHPEILHQQLPRPTKVLGFVDDPYSTYTRGIPYLWAFDAAFFISPGYNANHRFSEALRLWGCASSRWCPLVTTRFPQFDATERFFAERDIDVVYVGSSYGNKITRLAELKQHFGERLRVHGRWSFGGSIGWLRGLAGKPIYPHRVSPLSDSARRDLYLRAKIGINMHLSNQPSETGNMRMYEVPAHGAMLLCDKGALDAHAAIFTPGVEAVFYDGIADAIAQIEHFAAHPAERIAIARAGFERTQRDYNFEAVLQGLLDWASALRRQGSEV